MSAARRATPRTIQAIPLSSAKRPRPVWPTLVVVTFLLGLAFLEGAVPRFAALLSAVLS